MGNVNFMYKSGNSNVHYKLLSCKFWILRCYMLEDFNLNREKIIRFVL
jgi:hypothetical protein